MGNITLGSSQSYSSFENGKEGKERKTRSALHLNGKNGENFPLNGKLQFYHKQIGTGRVRTI